MLTFEGAQIAGTAEIVQKLVVCRSVPRPSAQPTRMTHPTRQSLPFQKVQHKVTTKDAQPSSGTVASLLVSVTGLLVVRPLPSVIRLDAHIPRHT